MHSARCLLAATALLCIARDAQGVDDCAAATNPCLADCRDDSITAANDWTCGCANIVCTGAASDVANKATVRCDQAACTTAVCCTTNECLSPTKGGVCTAAGQRCEDSGVVNDWTCDCTGVVCTADTKVDIVNRGTVRCTTAACTAAECCADVTNECLVEARGGQCTALGQVCNDPVQTAASVND
eukprot:Rhum_TRINITY_DN5642_c0_g1::Rhum_TRINITY_DN5642_c0_g1_i1::g.17811::m.17811